MEEDITMGGAVNQALGFTPFTGFGALNNSGVFKLAKDAITPRKPAPPPIPSLPQIPGTPDPGSTDVTGEVDRAVQRTQRQARTGGRLSTILTSPLGLTEPAATSKRTLLGR